MNVKSPRPQGLYVIKLEIIASIILLAFGNEENKYDEITRLSSLPPFISWIKHSDIFQDWWGHWYARTNLIKFLRLVTLPHGLKNVTKNTYWDVEDKFAKKVSPLLHVSTGKTYFLPKIWLIRVGKAGLG